MEPFIQHTGIVAPLDRMNVDTDLIIPKQFLKSVLRTGFGENLFDQLRYLDEGQPGMDNSARPINPHFILNQPRYQGVSILLGRENFGCGSSREHAPWALWDYGFRVVIAPSFADIFYDNCFKNGMLPIVLSEDTINSLFLKVEENIGYSIEVLLEKQLVVLPDFTEIHFDIDSFRKKRLLGGLDDIGVTLEKKEIIKIFEERRVAQFPWLFIEGQPRE